MLKKISKNLVILAIAVMGLNLLITTSVHAVGNNESSDYSGSGRLRSCQSRERNIKAIMARISDRADKRLRLFDSVSEKVQAYYRQNGVIIEGYDTLLAQVQAKRQAAASATEKIKTQGVIFDCESDDPKSVATAFQDEVRGAQVIYRDYRAAIKDLISGVKTAVEGASDER